VTKEGKESQGSGVDQEREEMGGKVRRWKRREKDRGEMRERKRLQEHTCGIPFQILVWSAHTVTAKLCYLEESLKFQGSCANPTSADHS